MHTTDLLLEHTARPPLSFWAIGDLHYRAIPAWNDFHTQRMAALFADLHTLWQQEGRPAFCAVPGDLIETGELANYQLVKETLNRQLSGIPFYPGIGNHEYYTPYEESGKQLEERFTEQWSQLVRYFWQVENFGFIMLDYPNPDTQEDAVRVFITDETLTFLDETLKAHASLPTAIFLHCPLRDTVLGRAPDPDADYNSTQHFFSPENSQQIRDILARHSNAYLVLSGHTHSGWGSPQLVVTESLGNHPVTFVNLMSPWYTGGRGGPSLSPDAQSFAYIADDPDVIPSFSFHLNTTSVTIRVREHRAGQWLKEWKVPIY